MAVLEVTQTSIIHGNEDGTVTTVPAGKNIADYSFFTEDELDGFRANGTIAAVADLSPDLTDDLARKNAEIADLRAKLEAALGMANQAGEPGDGAKVLNEQGSDDTGKTDGDGTAGDPAEVGDGSTGNTTDTKKNSGDENLIT